MQLPLAYRWLKAHGFKGLTPWYMVNPEEVTGLNTEYTLETGKHMLAFARRQDNDDVAGFELIEGAVTDRVVTVHLTWSRKREQAGWPQMGFSENIWAWLTEVVFPDTQDWVSESELRDVIAENGLNA